MIVTDSNSLNSYLKIPPYFSGGREAPSVFEIAAPRRVPDTLQDRGNEHEREAAEKRYPAEDAQRQLARKKPDRRESRGLAEPAYRPLIRLNYPPQGDAELNARLNQATQIRASLARSGQLSEQLVTAGGHAFDTPVQAYATLIAARLQSAHALIER